MGARPVPDGAARIAWAVPLGQPAGVFAYIASGVFGKAAFDGHPSMLLAGLLFHYGIAGSGCFTLFFGWLAARWSGLRQRKRLVGMLYGGFVWAVMNGLVVPLSNVQRGLFNLTNAVVNAVVLVLTVGLPLAFMADRFYVRRLPRNRSYRA